MRRLRDRAHELGEGHTRLAERYLREGLLVDVHPGIHFVDGPLGRRPALLRTGHDVWEVVKVVKDNGGSVDDAAVYLEVEPQLVHIAVAYYGSNREEIDDWLARIDAISEREEATWRAARRAVAS